MINSKDAAKVANAMSALGMVGNAQSIEILTGVAASASYDLATRQKAMEMVGKSRAGEQYIMEQLRSKKIPAELLSSAVAGLSASRTRGLYNEAKSYLAGASKEQSAKKATISVNEILALTGDAARGKAVFSRTCISCHQAGGQGFDFGPGLSEIGSKLTKESLFDAIVNPSAGINFGYETSQLDMKDGSNLMGIISSRTETDIEVKYPGGSVQKIKTADVKTINKLAASMMPEGLNETMTKQELADLVQYLSSLKRN